MSRFRLAVILPQNIPDGERFYLIQPRYCLWYTDAENLAGGVEVTDVSTLPELAKRWLSQCIDELRRERMAQEQEQLLQQGQQFHDALEAELKRERERLQGRAAEGGQT